MTAVWYWLFLLAAAFITQQHGKHLQESQLTESRAVLNSTSLYDGGWRPLIERLTARM
jgi:hypothetical protein